MTDIIPHPMDLKDAKILIARIEKGIAMGWAMDSAIGQMIMDLDERGGWETFENDDGSRRYKSVAKCLINEISAKLDIQKRQVKRYLAAARAEVQIFGKVIEGEIQVIVDPRLKRPALPERTTRELARLNDDPEKQRKAWERIMQITDGRPIAKVAQQVVDTMTGVYQKKKKARKRDVVQDPELKKIALMLESSMDDHIRLAEEKKAPEWVIKKLAQARVVLDQWATLIKV